MNCYHLNDLYPLPVSLQLMGTLEDWELVRSKAERLRGFCLPFKATDVDTIFLRNGFERMSADSFPEILSEWLNELLPVLDHFIVAAQGRPDHRFWASICSLTASMGVGDPMTGWITAFFPYTKPTSVPHGTITLRKNEYLGSWRQAYSSGIMKPGSRGPRSREPVIPCSFVSSTLSGVSKAPFMYIDIPSGKSYPMSFYGGLVSIHQDRETLALSVNSGWAVIIDPVDAV